MRSSARGRWALALPILALLHCEEYHHAAMDSKDLPTFESMEAGKVSESSWVVTAYAPDWERVSYFGIHVDLDDLAWPRDTADTADTADTGLISEEAATTRVTLWLDDGDEISFDYNVADPTHTYAGLRVPYCLKTVCSTVFHLRLETLTDGPVALVPSVEGQVSVAPDCLNNPREEDLTLLSVTVEPLAAEPGSARSRSDLVTPPGTISTEAQLSEPRPSAPRP